MTWIIALLIYCTAAFLFYNWLLRRAAPESEMPAREHWVLERVEEERRAA
jgi:hypothetical protein